MDTKRIRNSKVILPEKDKVYGDFEVGDLLTNHEVSGILYKQFVTPLVP